MSGGPEPSGDPCPANSPVGSPTRQGGPASDEGGTNWGDPFGVSSSSSAPPPEKTRPGKKAGRPRRPLKVGKGVFSSFPGPGPSGGWPDPPAPRAVLGVLAVGLLACLLMLAGIQARLESLGEDVAALRRREGVRQACGPAEDPEDPSPRQRPVGGLAPPVLRTRRTRDVGKTPQDPLAHQCKKHSVLHLVPARWSNNEEGDATEIWWAPFLHQGRALEPSGQDVVVRRTGLYFVYSQVLFHDPTFTMGQVLRRVALGKPDQILFRCVQSMPAKVEKAYNSCYSGGVFQLHRGDRLSLRIPRFNASFDITTHGTFLGVLRL